MAAEVAQVRVQLVCSVCRSPLSVCYLDPDANHVTYVLTNQSLDHLDTHNAA